MVCAIPPPNVIAEAFTAVPETKKVCVGSPEFELIVITASCWPILIGSYTTLKVVAPLGFTVATLGWITLKLVAFVPLTSIKSGELLKSKLTSPIFWMVNVFVCVAFSEIEPKSVSFTDVDTTDPLGISIEFPVNCNSWSANPTPEIVYWKLWSLFDIVTVATLVPVAWGLNRIIKSVVPVVKLFPVGCVVTVKSPEWTPPTKTLGEPDNIKASLPVFAIVKVSDVVEFPEACIDPKLVLFDEDVVEVPFRMGLLFPVTTITCLV